MKKTVGIWIDTKQAFIIKLSENNEHSIKKIGSNIETRERVEGETSKYGRFGNQYLTFEKNRLNKKNEQTNQYMKTLLKEINNCNEIVLFGPSNMKKILEKEIKKSVQLADKLSGVTNSETLTLNQMVAWVKDYYK